MTSFTPLQSHLRQQIFSLSLSSFKSGENWTLKVQWFFLLASSLIRSYSLAQKNHRIVGVLAGLLHAQTNLRAWHFALQEHTTVSQYVLTERPEVTLESAYKQPPPCHLQISHETSTFALHISSLMPLCLLRYAMCKLWSTYDIPSPALLFFAWIPASHGPGGGFSRTQLIQNHRGNTILSNNGTFLRKQ